MWLFKQGRRRDGSDRELRPFRRRRDVVGGDVGGDDLRLDDSIGLPGNRHACTRISHAFGSQKRSRIDPCTRMTSMDQETLNSALLIFAPPCSQHGPPTFYRHSNGRGCMEQEREALLKFKNGVFEDPHLQRLSSWVGDDCCTWFGVACDNVTGRVIELSLPNPHPEKRVYYDQDLISGFDPSMLRGRIDSSLADLRYLLHLDLSFNNFYPTPFPTFIGNSFQHLRYLNLSYAGFVGNVPPNVGNLSNLQVLDLSFNKNMTIENIGWLSKLSSLQSLDLSKVYISEKAPWFEAVNKHSSLLVLRLRGCNLENVYASHSRVNFTDLKVLDLSINNFRQTALPEWLSHLTSLQVLKVDLCNFTGPIPSYLGRMSALKMLHLYSNKFEGSVPESLWQLSELENLAISFNALEGNITELHFSNLAKLKVLDMSGNSFKFSISSTWVPPFQLKIVRLSDCTNMESSFPHWLRNQENIDWIYMSNANLQGYAPEWFWKILANATKINLSYNKIRGELPAFSSRLEELNVSNNFLSGSLRNNWERGSSLWFLDLANNELSGTIPSSFGNIIKLVSLHLGKNNLSGQLPLPMKNLMNLQFLDLHSNKLSGKIPSWIGENLSSLRILNLRSNLFHGEVPGQLSRLASLQILDMANNNLSGSIPKSLKNFKAMANSDSNNSHAFIYHSRTLVVSFSESMWIVTKGRESFYEDLWENNRKGIDLSMNKLSGSIPEELMELVGLQNLNLSGNFLQGPIPDKIGEMRKLQSLDLSRNRLSGVIPPTLSALSFLGWFSVSNNNLSGKIPFIGHLITFENSSYIGNEKLYGPPLSNKCPGDHETLQTRRDLDDHVNMSQEKEEDDEIEPWTLYIVTGSGFIGGICSVFGVLIANKSWRDMLYRFSDDMFERFIVAVILWRIRIKRMLILKD
ncbi:hypothetical protein H6P81_017007 [Aristolochia fimbriata]|uniref:Leucine-rich repeat-containing N-terminal plant-type domain-containing protein n=1 Tax=Aristolochia fimbriata TaxID=158543 RepID=A0AAV7E168_ARIFI|nr:hypothetical protein H6P81_017007 [Aristolochia fimbriata]